MKTKYYTRYSIYEPVECFGVIKIVTHDSKKRKNMYDNREGYRYMNGEWVRDDYGCIDDAFGENMDWFEADEEEAREAMAELDGKNESDE